MITTEEWRSVRASQKYPIRDNASCMSESNIYLPSSFILDIHIVTPVPITENEFFFISKIYSSYTTYCIQISIYDNSKKTELPVLWASAQKNLQLSGQLDQSYRNFYNVYKGENKALSKVYGHCTVGITKYIAQQLVFAPQSTRLNDSCIVNMQNAGIEAIKVGNDLLTGIVKLEGTEGIIITVDKQNNSIRIALDTQYVKELAEDYYTSLKIQYDTAVRSINGVLPVDGNINIIGLDCVKVDKIGQSTEKGILMISNTCAKPCCTISQETQNLQKAIAKITEQHQILKDYYNSQLTVINYMQTNLSTLLAQGASS